MTTKKFLKRTIAHPPPYMMFRFFVWLVLRKFKGNCQIQYFQTISRNLSRTTVMMRHKIISRNAVFYGNFTQQSGNNPSAMICTKQRFHKSQGGAMHILKKQDGMSTIGWILFIGLMIAVAIPGMKIIPIYMNNFKIHNALKKWNRTLPRKLT